MLSYVRLDRPLEIQAACGHGLFGVGKGVFVVLVENVQDVQRHILLNV